MISRARVASGPLRIALALALIGAGCGDDAATKDSEQPSGPPAWGLPEQATEPRRIATDLIDTGPIDMGPVDTDPIDTEACDLVLVIVIDGVTRDEFTLYGASAASSPRIDAVASGAAVYTEAIAVSTGGNAGLASILTGRHSREHGVASLRELGRSRLAPSERTLAEAFRDLDWGTVASFSESRQARGFAGFAQGFDTFEAPRLGEAPRPADAVVLGALQGLQPMFTAGRRVFAFVSFGDLGAKRRGLPPAAHAAPFVEARLRPFAARRADVVVQLERLALDPEGALAELKILLGRARGSQIARAWRQALRDAQLNEIDVAVGTLLDMIDAAGRAETATVIICAPRGRAASAAEARAGARYTPSLLNVPLIVRWPHGARRGRFGGVTSVIDAPRALSDVFGLGLTPTRFGTRALLGVEPHNATAFVSDGQLANFAGVRGREQIERYGLSAETFTFPRGGDAPGDGSDDAALTWPPDDLERATFSAFAAPATVTVTRAPGAPALRVRWRAAGSGVIELNSGEGTSAGRERRIRLSGSTGLSGAAAGTLELAIEKRSKSIWLDLDAGDNPLPTSAVAFGPTPVSELPVLFLPSDRGEPARPEVAARLCITRADGVWWRLAVAGEGPVEVLIGTWPPRSPGDSLEVVAGGPVLRHDVAGREDLAYLIGEAPFDLRIKKAGKEDFAIACRQGDEFLLPTDIVVDGLRYGTASAFSILIPSWQPEISEAFGDTTGALYVTHESNAPGEPKAPVTIRRHGIGPVRGADGALDLPTLQFLKTLAPGE